ncbi:FAD-dependent oxidoreductase [Streptomyces sp. NPDC087263]|uniref:FAD-dependent oxidoreductase n=1 Tax=Streptomyces sp. NPDC087263 TaxID=3365773 RepID=UPI00381DEC9C
MTSVNAFSSTATSICDGLYTRDDATQVVFGVAEELLAELRGMGAVSEPARFTAVAVVFDPESVKRAADEMCARAGADVLLHSSVLGATRVDDRLTTIRLADHSGIHEVTAKAFVDATGEADLAHHAGSEVRYGNDGWVQNGTLGVRLGGIPAGVEISSKDLKSAVRAAKRAGVEHLTSETGLTARMPISGDLITYLADEGYDARDAADTSRAEAGARRQAQEHLRVFRTLPGCGDAYIVSTGPELGTRESRHVVGRYQLTEKEVLSPGPIGDAVAVGAWPIEYHPGPGVPSEWKFIGRPGYYGIPLDVLRSCDTANLFAAGRTVDGDRGAGGSLRVMGTALATGHAAGVAAALTARDGDTGTGPVRAELLSQGAWLPQAYDELS